MGMDVNRMLSTMRLAFIAVTALLFSCGRLSAQEALKYMAQPAVPMEPVSVKVYTPHFKDTLDGDTLYQSRAANGWPVSYARKIHASVCFDNKCRLLNVIVHWNPTGRYLGIELPPGEFLSKAEHEPFLPHEYERLHTLLADANSPLGGFSYNEIVPRPASPSTEIDAVSSPTAKHLLEYVVEGAAFTTFKLWHIVHGTTRDEISKLTAEQLSPDLLLKLLESPVDADKIWALNHRQSMDDGSGKISRAIFGLMASPRYNLAERAIHAVAPADLSGSSQIRFVEHIWVLNHTLKKLALVKLRDAQRLTPEVIKSVREHLNDLSGEHLGIVLEVFTEKSVYDDMSMAAIAKLLANPNFFVARQVYEFLQRAPVKEKRIVKEMRRFEAKQGLH